MEVNYESPKDLFHHCIEPDIPIQFALLPLRPMAGATTTSSEDPRPEQSPQRLTGHPAPDSGTCASLDAEINSQVAGSSALRTQCPRSSTQAPSVGFHHPVKQGDNPKWNGLAESTIQWTKVFGTAERISSGNRQTEQCNGPEPAMEWIELVDLA